MKLAEVDLARIHVETRFLGDFSLKKMAGGFSTTSLCVKEEKVGNGNLAK
jgi:hypothetical protein